VLEATKQLAGGNRFTREKMYGLWESMADLERTLIWGDYSASYASKNTTTGVQTGYTGEFPTTRGIANLAGNSFDAKGALNMAAIRRDLPLAMGDTIVDDQLFIAYCGNELYARIQEMLQDKHYNTEGEGELKQWGIKSRKLITSGPTIELVKHEAFNVGSFQNQMLVFAPENLGYVYLEGHDFGPNNGIQLPATHGKTDELYCYGGLETKDAGKSICLVTNCF
jgi:hypothetical protein